MCDFAPESRGTAPWSRCEKLNAPGIVGWEFDCVIEKMVEVFCMEMNIAMDRDV